MKYWIAGLTALVASCIVTPSARAVDVCGYTATGVQGVNCPVRNGQTVCLSVSTAIGPCDAEVQCFGGPGFFCRATLIPKSGPEAQCPFSSVRPRGFNCFAKRLLNPTSTPTAPPVETETATFTATDTPEEETPTPTDTVPAGATPTDTPPELTPTETATGTPTGTAAATATDTPQEATPTETATEVPPATATGTATGTPTGTTAASLVLRF